jgi:hypothetical protein
MDLSDFLNFIFVIITAVLTIKNPFRLLSFLASSGGAQNVFSGPKWSNAHFMGAETGSAFTGGAQRALMRPIGRHFYMLLILYVIA